MREERYSPSSDSGMSDQRSSTTTRQVRARGHRPRRGSVGAKSFVEDEKDSLAREAPTVAATRPLEPDDLPLSPGGRDAEQTLVDLSKPDDDDVRSIRSNRSIVEKPRAGQARNDASDSALYTPGVSDAELDEEDDHGSWARGLQPGVADLSLSIPEMKPRAVSNYPTTRPSREVIEGLVSPEVLASPSAVKSSFLAPDSAVRHDHASGFPRRSSARPANESIPSLNKRAGGAYAQSYEQDGKGAPHEANTALPKTPPSMKNSVKAAVMVPPPYPVDATPSIFMPDHNAYAWDPRPQPKRVSSEYPDGPRARPSAIPDLGSSRPDLKRISTDYHPETGGMYTSRTRRDASRSRASTNASENDHILSPKPERVSTMPFTRDRGGASPEVMKLHSAKTYPMDGSKSSPATDRSTDHEPGRYHSNNNRLSTEYAPRNPSRLSSLSRPNSRSSTRPGSPNLAVYPEVPLKKMTPVRSPSWDEWAKESDRTIMLCDDKRLTHYKEWYVLKGSDSVDLCTKCYDRIFAKSPLSQSFQITRNHGDEKVRCEMSHAWVVKSLKDAKRAKDPDKFLDFIVVAAHNFCVYHLRNSRFEDPGDIEFSTIRDPVAKHRVKGFDVCSNCVPKLLVMFPNLREDMFWPSPRPKGTQTIDCDLRDDLPRWESYIAMFSRTSLLQREEGEERMLEVLAHWLGTPPGSSQCPETQMLENGYWHVTADAPDFTVCPECYWREVQSRAHRDKALRKMIAEPVRIRGGARCLMSTRQLRNLFLNSAEEKDFSQLNKRLASRSDQTKQYNRAIRKHAQSQYKKKEHALKLNTLRNRKANSLEMDLIQQKLDKADEEEYHYAKRKKEIARDWALEWDDSIPAEDYELPEDMLDDPSNER